MKAEKWYFLGFLAALLFAVSCAGAGQEVQAGRLALQTRRPHNAVNHFKRAAELDPNYTVSHWLNEGVLGYLGRSLYETGNVAEARGILEKALTRNPDDHAARLYLGLALIRANNEERGRAETARGLNGIHDWLESISMTNSYGIYWDPTRQIRSEIERISRGTPASADLIPAAERVGSLLDEEIDKAQRDEVEDRYGRRGDS